MATIIERKGSFYLRKTFGKERVDLNMGANRKTAESRAIRFIATAESSGVSVALEELRGKPVIKAGCNPTFDEMEKLYREFCESSGNPPRPQTIRLNLGRLKVIMARCGFERVGDIDHHKISGKWFKGKARTPTEKRTYASALNAAGGVFKVAALDYYARRNIPLKNPFKGAEKAESVVTKYVPVSEEIRKAIWNDCRTELAPFDAMVVLLALGAGMRRSEICAAIPTWFSVQKENVLIHIKEEPHFQPKEVHADSVPIPLDLYNDLKALRGNSDSFYFVPSSTDNEAANRLNKRYDKITTWLKSKGMTDRKPIHALRKECGSLIAKERGIVEAAKVLRNTQEVCMKHYAGVAGVSTVDMGASFAPAPDPAATLAAQLGISLEDLKAKLGIA